MTFGQKFMLLFSLFFFFGMLYFSLADFGGKKTAALISGAPQSVLHYPQELVAAPQETIPCYTGDSFDKFIAQKTQAGYTLTMTGDLSDGDKMEIYTTPGADYIVMVKGPDKTGTVEGCQVTEGWKFSRDPSSSEAAPQSDAATETPPTPAAESAPTP